MATLAEDPLNPGLLHRFQHGFVGGGMGRISQLSPSSFIFATGLQTMVIR